MTFDRLLVACDRSEQATAAVEFALALLADVGGRVTLAHVVEPPEPYPELPQAAAGIERMVELCRPRPRRRRTAR